MPLLRKILCLPIEVYRRYRDYPRLKEKLRETEERYESMLETLHQRHADIVEDLYQRHHDEDPRNHEGNTRPQNDSPGDSQ